MENETTGEIMEFYRKEENDGGIAIEYYYLIRQEKGSENQRIEWEEEFKRENTDTTTIRMP